MLEYLSGISKDLCLSYRLGAQISRRHRASRIEGVRCLDAQLASQ
jgi:hypothetical protein